MVRLPDGVLLWLARPALMVRHNGHVGRVESDHMELRDKAVYTQIHPIKPLTDWGGAAIGLVLLWNHEFFEGVIVAIVPSLVSSFFIIRYADLDRYGNSDFGKYFAAHSGRIVAWARIVSLIVMGYAAWQHLSRLIVLGAAIVLLAWGRDIIYLLKETRGTG